MKSLKVRIRKMISVPPKTKQIDSGDDGYISLFFVDDGSVFYYTTEIDKLPDIINEDTFTRINPCEITAMKRALMK